MRTCLGCRAVKDKRFLVRFIAKGGALSPDLKGSAPGRGAYVCVDEGCLREAFNKKGSFSRALKATVAMPPADEAWSAITAGLKF